MAEKTPHRVASTAQPPKKNQRGQPAKKGILAGRPTPPSHPPLKPRPTPPTAHSHRDLAAYPHAQSGWRSRLDLDHQNCRHKRWSPTIATASSGMDCQAPSTSADAFSGSNTKA